MPREIEVERFIFAKNPSYLASVKLGLLAALWWAPLTLLRSIGPGVISFLGATGYVIVSALLWILTRLWIVIAGFTGHLTVDSSKG